jgi:hypothetical protein
MELNRASTGEFAAGGNVRTPMKSGLATISRRESCTGAKHFDDANMAETPIKINACYHEFGSKLIFWFLGNCSEIID